MPISPDDKRMERMVSALDAHSAPDNSRHPSSDADDGFFDGREMAMVHEVLRREFGLLPDVVASITPEEQGVTERARSRGTSTGWSSFCIITTALKTSTYGRYWPNAVTREKLTARMESEHEEVAECLDTVVKALELWDVERTVRRAMCLNIRCENSFRH
jgi:hypothetical protein